MTNRSTIGAALLMVILCMAAAVRPQRYGATRDVFLLELPDLSAEAFTKPTIPIGSREIETLRVRVLAAEGKRISYGSIIVTLNGEGINRGCSKSARSTEIIVTCQKYDPSSNTGFRMAPGKNVLELSARDSDQNEYYASFVLDRRSSTALAMAPPSGPAESFTGRKFALVMGVSDYRFDDAGLTKLQYADSDAIAIADFLKRPEGGGFRSADIMLLVNGDASVNALKGALAEIGRRAGRGDLVFIFLAGHGGADPYAQQNMYFLFSDSKLVDLPHTAFPMSDLKLALDTQIRAERVIVVVDTCHSAGIQVPKTKTVGTRDLERPTVENNIVNLYASKQLFRETGRAILTSSDVNEVSRESDKWNKHGVFTWALLEGLSGKADKNNDGAITTGELFVYTRGKVQTETNYDQNPIALPGSATNLVLAQVKH
jgi:hypothetical protein